MVQNKEARIYHIGIIFLILLSTCYQDFFLFNYFSAIGRTPLILMFPFLIYYGIKKIAVNSYWKEIDNVFKYLLIAYFISSFINLLIWFFLGEHLMSYIGENVIVKVIKYVVYYIQLYLIYRSLSYLLFLVDNRKIIANIFFVLLIIHLGILVIESLTLPNAFTFLHIQPLYYRIRLLTPESSYTGAVLVLIVCSLLMTTESKIHRITALVFLGYFFITSGSKMFLIAFPLSFLLSTIIVNKVNIVKSLLISSIVIIPFTIFALPILVSSFTNDIENYSSTITRTSAFLSGLKLGIMYPYGTGGFYYYYLLQELPSITSFVTGIFGGGKLSELQSWGAYDDNNIAAGSTFAEWVMIVGPFGAYLYFKLCKAMVAVSKVDKFALMGVIYFLITNSFSESIQTKPNWVAFIAVLVYVFYDKRAIKDKILVPDETLPAPIKKRYEVAHY